MDRLDRRQRPLLGQRYQGKPRDLRYPQGNHLASEPDLLRRSALRPQFALASARRGRRTLLRETDRSRPEAIRALARRAQCRLPADPFDNEAKYPGVKLGARGTTFKDGTTLRVGSYFGYATGIVGLRPLPIRPSTKPPRTNGTPSAITPIRLLQRSENLVRPYRVGMACGFCHVGPSRSIRLPIQLIRNGPISIRRWATSISGWIASLSMARTKRTSSSARPFVPARYDGHVARLDRLHQQPAHQ